MNLLCKPRALGGSPFANEELEILDQAIQVKSDANNVVYDYLLAVNQRCQHPLLLMWNPSALINCDSRARSYFIGKRNITAYQKFKDEISPRFQRKALNLLTQVQVKVSLVRMAHG